MTNINIDSSTNIIDASNYITSININNYITNIEEISKSLSTNRSSYLIV